MLRLRAIALPVVLALLLPASAAADVTSTSVSGPATPLVHGDGAALVATVTNTTMPSNVPTGSVQFSVDGAPVGGPAALSPAGVAQVETQVTAGTRNVRASYLGAAGFDPSEGTASLLVARAPTATTVSLTPAGGAVAGQDLAFAVQVTPAKAGPGVPTGTVTLSAFGTPLLQAPLGPDGAVRGGMRLPVVSLTAVVAYSGDASYAASQTSLAVTVDKAGTVTTLAASPNPARLGETVTFDATVDSLAPSMWWPIGVLTRTIDGQPVPGAVTVDGNGLGRDRFTQTFTTPGLHRVAAHFAGDDDFGASDAALDVTVTGTPPATRPVAPRGLTIKAVPARDRRAPYRFTVTGRLQLPSGASVADAARGKVTVDAKVKSRRVARKTASVDRNGGFKVTLTLPRKGTAKVTAAFAGNARVAAVASRALTVKAG